MLPAVSNDKALDVSIGKVAFWIELNGGKLTVTNTENKGSEAQIVFPASVPDDRFVREPALEEDLDELIGSIYEKVVR